MKLDEATKELRKTLGLSQQKLANQLEMGLATIQRWEQGTATPVPAALVRLYRLARENQRDDLAAVFVQGTAVVSDSQTDAVLDALPHIGDYFGDAIMMLTQSIADPNLTKEKRNGLIGTALETLMEGKKFVDRVILDTRT